MPIRVYKHKKPSLETRRRMSIAQRKRIERDGYMMSPESIAKKSGEKAYQWKGKNASYIAKHAWLYRKFGQPETCEHCGKTGLKGKFIHWANKDHKYRRRLEDWMRLCHSCHYKYDMENNLRKKKLFNLDKSRKLSDKDVVRLVRMIKKGYTNEYISDIFHVTRRAVYYYREKYNLGNNIYIKCKRCSKSFLRQSNTNFYCSSECREIVKRERDRVAWRSKRAKSFNAAFFGSLKLTK